jgi:transposase
MNLADLLATLPPGLRDYVRELEARATALEMQASALQARNQFLEEQFRLAQLKRFAPSSEKFGAPGLPVQ